MRVLFPVFFVISSLSSHQCVNKFGYGRGVVIIICMCEEFSYEGKERDTKRGKPKHGIGE
jgi:hypothetical protein